MKKNKYNDKYMHMTMRQGRYSKVQIHVRLQEQIHVHDHEAEKVQV